jgi:Rieske 2Fe-2S family protein
VPLSRGRYHAWTYGLEGKLGHVTLPRCFSALDRDATGLVAVPCEARHGFLWVVPTPASHGARIDVAASLGEFDDDFASFELDQHVVFGRSTVVRAANWKLVMDAFLEGYHVRSLHQKTLARFFRDEMIVDTSGSHVRSAGARKSLPELRVMPPETWDLRATTTVFYSLFPNTVLVLHPQTISHVAIFPRALDQVEFIHTMLVPHEPRNDEERSAWQKTWELIDGRVFAEEDLAIAESIQSGLHAVADGRFHLGTLEQPIRFFHDAMDRALAEGAPPGSS